MTLPAAGKWMCSTNEEQWDCREEFDSEEEALAYALSEFAPDYGLEPGDRVFVGQVEEIDRESMAEYAADDERVVEAIGEYIYERVGDDPNDEPYDISVSREQQNDLGRMLRATIVEWMTKHDLRAPCFSIGRTSSHVVPDRDESAE